MDDADKMMASGNYSEAIKQYNRAIARNDKFSRAYANRGITYEKMGQIEKALQDLNMAIEFAGNDPFKKEYHYHRAMLLHQLKQYEEAIKDYDEAVRLNGKDDPTVLRMRARANAALGKYPEALADFDKSIAASPEPLDHAFSLLERGLANKAAKKQDEALKDLTESIKLYEQGFDGSAAQLQGARQRLPMAYFERGRIYQSQGKKDLAKEDWAKANYLILKAEQKAKPPETIYSKETHR